MPDTSGWQVPSDAPRHYEEQTIRFMKPFAQALVSAVIRPGDSVLDLACGTGIATRIARTAAGPGARIVGSDINRSMLEFARNVSEQRGDGIRWKEASAIDLPFSDAEFDSVICQQGVQFFPDPSAGLREMIRVAKPGGTIAFTVWSPLADSPYFEAMHSMLIRYCNAEPADVAWYADKAVLSRWLDDAGVPQRTIDRVVESVDLPPLDTFVPAHMQATPWADTFNSLTSLDAATAVSEMREHLSRSGADSDAGTNFSSYLVTAVT
jgi:ubiquinone/menaquinone biosynthesis C-methylase UbiE